MNDVVNISLPSVAAFLQIAVRSALLLKEVQVQRAFHGCINPVTLAVHETAPAVSAASLLEISDAAQNYAYISPEQTGRLNRGVDKRSDYYSLGVVFYELLTGRLPFMSRDALELVHSHIAQQPAAPHSIVPDIPPAVSGLILKLLSKNAEDRYQSIEGLLADLSYCERTLQENGTIAEFALGRHDRAGSLQFSARLYGRDAEIRRLRQAFGRVVHGGNELMLICGYSGVGKSSLAHAIQQTVVAEGGIYLTGKFDQYKSNIPYATLAEAFRLYLRMLLSSSEVDLARWRGAIQHAVGKNGRLLADLIPELDYFIGMQPELIELGPAEAQNRFLSLFRQFVAVFAKAEHPLVIFLDDLQWLDAGSMKLLEHLATHSDMRHLLLIGSYRDNEVDAGHPLMQSFDAIRNQGGVIERMVLAPLTQASVGQITADTLGCTAQEAAPLAQMLFEKTAGNPFFAVQFIATLHDDGLLAFDVAKGAWQWDMARINSLSFTDNVVDLMVAKLDRLPRQTLHLLQNLACLSASAPVALLARIMDVPVSSIETLLDEARHAGLLIRVGDQVKLSHDRIQEAAYSMIPPVDRQAMHLHIGRLMLALCSQDDIESRVFDLVHQFNRGSGLINSHQEQATVCRLNMLAGRKAKASVAFLSAQGYLVQAIALLPATAWQEAYDATFALYLDCTECKFVQGQFQDADTVLDSMLLHVRTNYDRARIALLRIRMYYAATRGPDSLRVGLDILTLLGVTFPQTDAELHALAETGRQTLLDRLHQRSIADLIDLPVADDPDVRIIISLLSELLTAAYSTRPAIALPILIRALNMSLSYGNVEESCAIYSNYGLLLAGLFDDVHAGFAFSEMSMRLNERFDDQKWRGRLLFIHGYAFNGTRHPLASSLPLLEKAYTACREVGNVAFAGASIDAMVWMAWETGMPLENVKALAQPYRDFTRWNNTFSANCIIHMMELLCARLQGQAVEGAEQTFLQTINKAGWNYSIGHFHITQQVRHYTFGQYQQALEAAELAQRMPVSLHALASMVTHYFYHGLTLAALYSQADSARQPALRESLGRQLAKLEKWAQCCPQNYRNRYALLSAEAARIDGDDDAALRFYEDAIVAAREDGFPQHEALANELAAAYYRGRGLTTSANGHLFNARNGYFRWGAHGKLAQLDQLYPQAASDAEQAVTTASRMAGGLHDLDFIAVTKASQAVSSEIVLGKLTESLLKTMVENAGAERGLLILPTAGEFEIAAEAATQTGQVAVMLRQAPVQATDLPLALFHYVTRTHDKVLIDDATIFNPHAGDPYFAGRASKSVLCLPLLKQGKLVGILYLENRLAASAFTPGRMSMLELLASQAVISLENAALYSELQRENSERERVQEALKQKTGELEAQAFFMNTVIENIPVALFIKDVRKDFRFTLWNKAAEEIFQISKEEIIGRTNHELWPTEIADKFLADDKLVADKMQRIDIAEQNIYFKTLGTLLLHTIKVPLINPHTGQADFLLGISEDITERKRSESMIWQQANFDTLTGLPNRSRFRDQLLRDIGRCTATGSKLAVLFIDLDRFKEVNDTLGHDSGDMLLIEAARRIASCVRDSDTVARLGGDEFTVILPGLEQAGRIETIAQNMINALVEPFQLGAEQAFISASIGVTIYPDDATEIEELLKHADQALYVAKDSGRNRFGYYTPALQAAALHRMRLTNDLRAALEKGEFQVYFQPIVDAATGRINKAEALIRWLHPQRGLVSPAEFIPLAESSGLIMDIGEWVFQEAARWAKHWRTTYNPHFQISLNQSPLEFQRQEDRYERWLSFLHELDLPGQALVVEITEGLLLDANPLVSKKLLTLRDAGIEIALDDFGTGYSSLAYLKKFAIDYLKIDQTFTRNLAPGSSDMALTEAIIMMAHKLGLKVIAEGVETTEQHDLLRSAGCDYNQGYLFSRPVPAAEFDELLKVVTPKVVLPLGAGPGSQLV